MALWICPSKMLRKNIEIFSGIYVLDNIAFQFHFIPYFIPILFLFFFV